MDSQPILAPPADPAAQAFGRLADKIDLLETAIAGLAARRDAAPDYSETLGEIVERLNRTRDAIKALSGRPAMEITPDAMAARITEAGTAARAADGAAMAQARERFDHAAGWIERLADTIATVHEQRRRLAWMAGGGLLAGMLLWSFLPGVVLRALPQRWHMPENMARHIIGEPTLWDAGGHLMQAENPEAWRALNRAGELARENRDAIDECRTTADRRKRAAPCTIRISPDRQPEQAGVKQSGSE